MERARGGLGLGLLAACATLSAAAIVSSCSKESSSAAPAGAVAAGAPAAAGSATPVKRRWFIGATIDRLSNDYFVKIKEGIEARAKERGVEVSVQDARGDDAEQLTQVENFIRQKVDAIIIAAVNDEVPALVEAVKQARAQGMKVVAQSQLLSSADVYVSIRQHDYGAVGGEMGGAWIRDRLHGEANFAILGDPQRPTILEREKGLEDGVRKLAPKAKLVARIQAPSPEKARSNTEAALQQNPELQVLVAFNDESAVAAANAIVAKAGAEAAKSKTRYAVFGLDAIPAALDLLGDPASPLRGTVDIDPFGNGSRDLDVALDLLEGRPVEGAIPGEGGQSYLPVAMKPVTEKDLPRK
jgi:ABC-type sugar transport system substrate-binding protein